MGKFSAEVNYAFRCMSTAAEVLTGHSQVMCMNLRTIVQQVWRSDRNEDVLPAKDFA